MAVAPFSRLLLKPPPPPRAVPFRAALPVHLHPVPAQYSPLRVSSPLRLPGTRRPRRFSAQENGGASETLEESEADEGRKKEQEEEVEKRDTAASTAAASVAEELKEMMEARKKESSSSDLWGGVADEVREIEWPPFGKVLGTTGVVIAVIAGSSVALLTVNAILAEISDKVFAGKGIQDFF
ncbi:preprotein translocase subunit SECE1-like [Musa acuminata AAA Group]|uniref:preprotein translocase subunit SECE1 n=1 Tax=Musa acuminata AAA Group TaxID=214697 RepID=UPI0031E43525